MTKAKINKLSTKDFPKLLREINDPPKVLYIRGEMPPETDMWLCVVGARRHTNYGREVCEQLIAGLRGYPITIVSGLALGIDSIAHRGALAAGLKTVAVPGSGLDPSVLYPSSHKNLADEIVQSGGALISEFEPDFHATPWSFPQRNRIMAGLSNAVLVIEAEKKSGTLITSKFATEYNRDVFTVPGDIFSHNSEGPHLLIRLGATPITSSSELLEALGFKLATNNSERTTGYTDCTEEEKKIIAILKSPMSRDEIVDQLDLPVGQVNTLLSILEIKGYIKESLGEIHLA